MTVKVADHQLDADHLTPKVLNVGVGVLAGTPVAVGDLVGVTLTDADASGNAVVDLERKGWKFPVRNVTGYNASTGAESTFAAVAQGDKIYVDGSAAMPDGVFLSKAATNASGTANKEFGRVLGKEGGLSGTATAETQTKVEILVAA